MQNEQCVTSTVMSSTCLKRKRADTDRHEPGTQLVWMPVITANQDFPPVKSRAGDSPLKLRQKTVKPSHFRFLDLPAEIRNKIYECLLVEPRGDFGLVEKSGVDIPLRGYMHKSTGLHRFTTAYPKPRDKIHLELHPNVLRTSKFVYNEAISVLYSQNLIFNTTHVLLTFLACIGPENAKLLRKITLRRWVDYRRWRGDQAHADILPIFTILSLATPNLRRITFDRHIEDEIDDVFVKEYVTYTLGRQIRYWAQQHDKKPGNGEGNWMKVISFTDVCFGSEDAIKLYGTRISRRKDRAMEALISGVEDLPFSGNPHERS